MKAKRLCTVASPWVLLVSCGPNEQASTHCAYDKTQIENLETRAALDDRNALRELDLCYSFDSKDVDRERIHRRRVELGEPEALNEVADTLILSARKVEGCREKMVILRQARIAAMNAALKEKLSDPTQYSTVKLVDQEIGLACK